jgi:hypothetical protein
MPTSFLDLPREIRDIIYGLALTSSTSHYLLTLYKPPPIPRLPSLTSVRFQPCNPRFKRSFGLTERPNLALQRTSQQIHAETQDWIWRHNTILFASANDTIAILKHMGQSASRQIQKVLIRIDVGWNRDKTTLVKALNMLASRTRRGELREVGLLLDLAREIVLPSRHLPYEVVRTQTARKRHKDTVYWLEKGAAAGWEAGKVKRTLDIRHNPGCDDPNCTHGGYFETLEIVVMDCHLAWGGSVSCNGDLIWDDGAKVGEISKTMPAGRYARRVYGMSRTE